MYSVCQHCTTWRSDHCVFHQSTLYHMAVRSLSIPPVNTVPHGGQIIVYSVSQHCTILRSDHRVFHLSTLHYMAVRSLCIIPVNTVPHRHRVFRQSTLYHMAVKSSCIPSVTTVLYGGQLIVYSTNEQCTIWWSDRVFCQPVLKWLL